MQLLVPLLELVCEFSETCELEIGNLSGEARRRLDFLNSIDLAESFSLVENRVSILGFQASYIYHSLGS